MLKGMKTMKTMKSILATIQLFICVFFLGGCTESTNYAQATPKETLESIIEVIENDKIEDFISYLAEPTVIKEEMEGTDEEVFKKQLRENMIKNLGTIKSFLNGKSEITVHEASINKEDGSQLVFWRKNNKWYFVCSFGSEDQYNQHNNANSVER